MTDEMIIDRESETRLEARSTSAQELLHQWLAERRSEGYCPAQIFNATLASGWTREAAVAAMGHVMGDMVTQKELDLLLRGTPEPDLNDSPSSVVVEGREVQILFEMQNPRVVVFGGLLSDDECDQIVEIAWSRVQRSTVMSDEDFDGGVVSDIRTSQGAFLKRGEFDVCNRIDARIEVLLNWPIDCTEDLQVLRYEKGGEYKAHYDFFDTAAGHWTPTLRRGGHRCGTLLTYLSTPLRGGGTLFPDVPLEVRARKGVAVYFGYRTPDFLSRTLHAGSPVIEGEKWAAVKWFRQGPHL